MDEGQLFGEGGYRLDRPVRMSQLSTHRPFLVQSEAEGGTRRDGSCVVMFRCSLLRRLDILNMKLAFQVVRKEHLSR